MPKLNFECQNSTDFCIFVWFFYDQFCPKTNSGESASLKSVDDVELLGRLQMFVGNTSNSDFDKIIIISRESVKVAGPGQIWPNSSLW